MKKYHRAIVFSKVPLKSVFRYKDLFQLYPANLENLPSYHGQRHYPLLLEYWTTDEDNVTVHHELAEISDLFSDTTRTMGKQDIILSLLTFLSNHYFFRYTDLDGSRGLPMLKEDPTPEEANAWSSKWCIPWFIFPGLPAQLKITEFSKVDLKSTPTVQHVPYYTNNPNLDLDTEREITFPGTIFNVLDAYFELAEETKAAVDNAIYYLVSAVEVRRTKKTLALLSSFTAVETMINWEFRGHEAEKCEVCGQLKYSVARKFREYLLKYVGNSDTNKKKFNAYYSLRSKVTHTGHLLKNELLFSDVPKADREKDYMTSLEVLQLGKLSVANWLVLNVKS